MSSFQPATLLKRLPVTRAVSLQFTLVCYLHCLKVEQCHEHLTLCYVLQAKESIRSMDILNVSCYKTKNPQLISSRNKRFTKLERDGTTGN